MADHAGLLRRMEKAAQVAAALKDPAKPMAAAMQSAISAMKKSAAARAIAKKLVDSQEELEDAVEVAKKDFETASKPIEAVIKDYQGDGKSLDALIATFQKRPDWNGASNKDNAKNVFAIRSWATRLASSHPSASDTELVDELAKPIPGFRKAIPTKDAGTPYQADDRKKMIALLDAAEKKLGQAAKIAATAETQRKAYVSAGMAVSAGEKKLKPGLDAVDKQIQATGTVLKAAMKEAAAAADAIPPPQGPHAAAVIQATVQDAIEYYGTDGKGFVAKA